LFMFLSLAIAFALKFENPYWIPMSCVAGMQGASTKHIWARGVQRIVGTLVGWGLSWLIISGHPSELMIIVSIILLQVIVEFLVVRNYTLAVVFITLLTIFLAESGGKMA